MHSVLGVLAGFFWREDNGKEKDYEVQNDGSGGVGRGGCCGGAPGDGGGRGGGRGGGSAAATASQGGEGDQPDGHRRGHCVAPERSTCHENAGDWAEHVAVGGRGREVLADLQSLREGLATGERSQVCAVEAVRGDVGNDVRPGCNDLCAQLARGRRAGAGTALEVCAGGKPGVAGKEGGDVFSDRPAAEHDDRSAIVFADSVGACEGVGEQERNNTRYLILQCNLDRKRSERLRIAQTVRTADRSCSWNHL